MRIAICDDEQFYSDKIRNGLETLLEERGVTEYQIDVYKSGEELCSKQELLEEYHIIFLDVNMDEMSGIEAAREIRNVNEDVYLVFVTAYIDYAVEGYKVDAIRFIIKDVMDNTLPECIDTILARMRYRERRESFAFVEGEMEAAVHNICYIASEKHRLIFYIYDRDELKEWTLYGKLDDVEKRLENDGFIRIHKSFLVNVKMMIQVKNYKVVLKNRVELPVPRERFQDVKRKYFKMMGEI